MIRAIKIIAVTLISLVVWCLPSTAFGIPDPGYLIRSLANFISNTVTAALLIPILTVIGTASKDTLAPYGGVSPLLIGIALSASLAMVLPISTPPNALAHATGMIEQKQMMRVGLIMGGIGFIVGYALLIVLGKMGAI